MSGIGLGIGGAITIGAMEALYRSSAADLDERTTLRPFPQLDSASGTKKNMWTRYRTEMISKAGFAIFMCGNKLEAGAVVEANGMIEEFDLSEAQEFKITLAEAGGAPANDLRDQRAELLNELGKRIEIHTFEDASGQTQVFVGRGNLLVERDAALPLSGEPVASNGGYVNVFSNHQDIWRL